MAEGHDDWFQPRTNARRLEVSPRVFEATSKTNYQNGQMTNYGSSDTKKVLQTKRIEHPEQGDQSQGHEWTKRTKHEDRQTGNYERLTVKEKVSSGEMYLDKPTSRVGFKDEYKSTSTIRIGNKRGYTELYTEERVKNVSFGNKKSSSNTYNNRLTYDED